MTPVAAATRAHRPHAAAERVIAVFESRRASSHANSPGRAEPHSSFPLSHPMSDVEDGHRGTRVMLMATCLCDAFFPDVAQAAVEVLEFLGCEVIVPEAQTCCGQPPYNGGDFPSARRIARHGIDVFAGAWPVVVPSGSCAAMNRHGSRLLFEGERDADAAERLGERSWELTDFIVNRLGVDRWPGEFRGRVAIHHSCHTRGSGTIEALRLLIGSIEGVELVEFGQDEQCCGFGGTFSVAFPHISAGIGELKLDHLAAAHPDLIVSADMSCLMHLGGLDERRRAPGIERRHASQLLRDALRQAGRIA